jgi:hypothetical protein
VNIRECFARRLLRENRHETLYGLETRSSEGEAEHSLRRAREFLSMVKTIL